jgi:hypothetical protein
MSNETNSEIKPISTLPIKSKGISIILTIIFGPVGLFYADITGAIIMCIASIALGNVFSGTLLPFCYVISIIWGIISVNVYNDNIIQNNDNNSK